MSFIEHSRDQISPFEQSPFPHNLNPVLTSDLRLMEGNDINPPTVYQSIKDPKYNSFRKTNNSKRQVRSQVKITLYKVENI